MLLGAYHLLILGRFYLDPFSLARSELLSTFFPTWVWQGQQWRKGKVPKHDPYFWLNAHAHPVVSTYYPLGILSSRFGQSFKDDSAFRILVFSIGLHFLFASIGWYFLCALWSAPLISLLGAITLTYNGYNLKQQPCILYTIAWFPWMLLGVALNNQILLGLSCGLTLLAGYYPIGIQTVLVTILASVAWAPQVFPIGFLLGGAVGAVQLVPFLKYLPKTIRAHKHDDLGVVPWWHFLSLVFPKSFRRTINGAGFWEMSYYIGLVPLCFIWFQSSRAVVLVVASILLMTGLGSRFLPRIPARWAFLFAFGLSWCAISGLANLRLSNNVLWALVILQAFDLYWHSRGLMPADGYSELPQRPSRAFNTPTTRFLEKNLGTDRVSGLPYPLFTGHINKLRTLGYSGGMQLKLMAKFRNDKNTNGSGEHDWFRSHDEWPRNYRVRFTFSRKKLDWESPLRNLYENPA